MPDIMLASTVRASLMALQGTDGLIAAAQKRLATGRRVNTAFDNPTVFFAASALGNRAGDLSSVLDGITGAYKTLESANSSLTSLTNLVTSAQSTARSALASAGTTARTTGSVAGLSGTSSFTVAATKTITVSDGTLTATVTSAGAVTVQQIMDGVNNTAGLKVKASLTADGKLQLETTQTNTIVVGGTASAAELTQYGLAAGTTAAGTLNASRSALATQFDAMRTQIDQLAKDANFNGVNLLNGGSLKVTLNEQSTSSLTIAGVTDTAAGLGIAASANTFQTDKDINDTLNNLTVALATLRAQSAVFASNVDVMQTRQDFTKSLISTLKSASDSLTMADANEEGANLLALQTRQQLAATALSFAAQSDQGVLRLFR